MASLALIPIRLPCELRTVDVAVTFNTGEIADAVDHDSGGIRSVALGAGYRHVAFLQWKSTFGVLSHAECSRLETRDSVADVTVRLSGH